MTKLEPIRRRSLSDEVYEQLRGKIMSGEMEAGSALPAERALCTMLGVNRGALREALKRLEEARLVSIQHGGGTRVTDFRRSGGLDLLSQLILRADGSVDTRVAKSVIEMRAALGPDIARLAALRASPSVKARLEEIVTEMEETDELPLLQRGSMAFWDALVEGSGNVAYRFAFNTLGETYREIAGVMTQVMAAELTDKAGFRALAKSVSSGDAKKSESQARALLQKGADGMLEVIKLLDTMNGEVTP